MNCPTCIEVCHCPPEPQEMHEGTAAPGGPVEPNSTASNRTGDPTRCEPTAEAREPALANQPPAASSSEATEDEEDNSAWRDELSDRLNRYRSRRKLRPPRYPSLTLPFDPVESWKTAEASRAPSPPPGYVPTSNRALALDSSMEPVAPPTSAPLPQPTTPLPGSTSGHSAKIIEFPGFAWGPPPLLPDQLAEPVSDRPRILEAPELVPPPPALGGITIEAAEPHQAAKLPGIDIPLQSASLPRRILASAIDGLIIALATALFGEIFWKVTAFRPPQAQLLALAASIPCLLWVAYQYLLIVYSGTTPGLAAASLKLTRFDGTATTRSLRRWRVLAACLSAVSLGMGYAWVFLDEDVLCWHDRITHTYLAPKK